MGDLGGARVADPAGGEVVGDGEVQLTTPAEGDGVIRSVADQGVPEADLLAVLHHQPGTDRFVNGSQDLRRRRTEETRHPFEVALRAEHRRDREQLVTGLAEPGNSALDRRERRPRASCQRP